MAGPAERKKAAGAEREEGDSVVAAQVIAGVVVHLALYTACPPIAAPAMPMVPSLAQDPNAWAFLAFIPLGAAYALGVFRSRLGGKERRITLIATSALMLSATVALVCMSLYHTSSLALYDWEHREIVQLGQTGCPATDLDFVYRHALASIEPFSVIAGVASTCFALIGLFVIGYLISLARQGRFTRRAR